MRPAGARKRAGRRLFGKGDCRAFGKPYAWPSSRPDGSPMPPTTTSYRTIKADLLTRIQAGEFPPGTRLPDEIDLAERFGVARTTVASAARRCCGCSSPRDRGRCADTAWMSQA